MKTELDTVSAENDALRERILSLECRTAGGGGGSSPGKGGEGLIRLRAELRVAQQTVTDMKNRNEKMTTHFVDASRRYRDAVAKVLGWRYAMRGLHVN